MKTAKRCLSVLLSLCLALGLIPGTALAASDNLPFTDVNTTDWYHDAVQYVYDKGMMSGTSATSFAPNETTSRGMIVTVLHRMEGTPVASGAVFMDVSSSQWYANAVAWASANNIVGGYGSGLFGPGDPITREQMSSILYRYSQYKGYPVSASGSLAAFPDAAQTSSYAVDAMNWAVGSGLIAGVSGNLDPKGSATRAQVATILQRYCENVVPTSTSAPDTSVPDTTPSTVDTTYTVTFDLNYGSDTQYDKKVVKAVETVSKPPNPSRNGYSFSGWYAEKSGGRQFDFKKGITSDLTLYAHWSKVSSGGGSRPVGDKPTTPPADGDRATGEELMRAAKIASQNLHSIEEPFRDDEGYVNKEDWPELLEKLDAWGKQAKAEGKLLDYASSKDEYSVTIQDPTGLVMCYVPPIQELERYAGSVQTYEPYYGVDEKFEKAKKKYGTVDQAAEKINALGYDFSTNADGKEVNFDALKQWKPGGVILWQGHGMGVNDFGKTCFGALMTTMKLEDHCEEFASYTFKGSIKNALVITDDYNNICVTPNFFDLFYQDGTSLRGSMIWLGSCYSAYQEGFASVFQKKGASLTIGSPGEIDIDYVVELADKFIDTLVTQNGTQYSAKEALAQAKKRVRCPAGSADMIAQGDDFRLSAATDEPTVISLSGVILDDVSKEAVRGAVVAIDGVNQATTDAFGKFTVKVSKDKDALPVRVVCNGYEDYEAIVSRSKVQKGWTITLTPAGKGNVTLPIRLDPNRGKVTNGTVAVYELTDVKRNEDGSIQGINDSGTFFSSKKLIKNVSFYRDTFEIGGLETNKVYSLEISPKGYNTGKLLYDCWEVYENTPLLTKVVRVTAVTPAKRSFTLTVTDLQTGKTISNAAVTLSGRSNDTEAYHKLTSGSTDAKGMFRVNVEGKYTDLRADVVKDGYITGAVETTEITASLSLSREPSQTIRSFVLTVTDLQTEKPISDAAVTLSGRSNDSETYQKITSGSTDAKGMFRTDVDGMYTDLRADVVKDGYIAGAVETTETIASLTLSKDPGQEVPDGYTPIYTAKDLVAMNGEGQGVLMNDIQIASYISVWNGVLEGNGHSIVFPNTFQRGPWIGENKGTLRNIIFVDVYRAGTDTNYRAYSALVGANSGMIENCEISSGRIVSSENQTRASGFAESNLTSGFIRNCINRAEISAKSTYDGVNDPRAVACGIASWNWGTIEGCINYGSIYAEINNGFYPSKSTTIVAGITGTNYGIITGCSNQGELSGKNSEGDRYVKIYDICPEN